MIAFITNINSHIEKENLSEKPCVFINNEEELAEHDISSTDVFVVQIELNWKGKNPTSFFGFEIIKKIRAVYKSTAAILIVSLLEKEYFLLQTKIKIDFEIINTPGHYFHHLPVDFSDIDFNALRGLDEMTLHDISNHLFTFKGILEKEIHDISNNLYDFTKGDDNEKKRINEKILKSVHAIGTFLDLHENSEYTITKDKFLAQIKEYEKDGIKAKDLMNAFDVFHADLVALLPPRQIDDEPDILDYPKRNWEVLFLDDHALNRKILEEFFQENNIVCRLAASPDEAFQILKDDTFNKITVFICDYRLRKENGEWYEQQGYNVLSHIRYNFENMLSMFSLTSFNRRTLLKVQRVQEMKVHIFSKGDVLTDKRSFDIFCETIISEGEKYSDLLNNIPLAKSWHTNKFSKYDQALKYYYRLYRNSPSFEEKDKKIKDQAEDFCAGIMRLKYGKSKEEEIEPILIQNEIRDKASLEEQAARFETLLLGRRVALTMHFALEMEQIQIYTAMQLAVYEQNPRNPFPRQFFSSYMALKALKNFRLPKDILLEEKEFVNRFSKKYLGKYGV